MGGVCGVCLCVGYVWCECVIFVCECMVYVCVWCVGCGMCAGADLGGGGGPGGPDPPPPPPPKYFACVWRCTAYGEMAHT